MIFEAYTHFAADGAPAVVHLYVLPVLVFRYISPTTAEDTPELGNVVAVVLVPVMPVPEYHLLEVPEAPLMDVLLPAVTVVLETEVMVYL